VVEEDTVEETVEEDGWVTDALDDTEEDGEGSLDDCKI